MDISYIPMARVFVHVAAVIDWQIRRVLAWRLSISMDTASCTEAVEEASTASRRSFKTDQGSQFTGSAFTGLLLETASASRWTATAAGAKRVHRTDVVLDQVQGGVPERLRDRERRPRKHRPPHQLLQHAPAALEPSGSTPDVVYLASMPSPSSDAACPRRVHLKPSDSVEINGSSSLLGIPERLIPSRAVRLAHLRIGRAGRRWVRRL